MTFEATSIRSVALDELQHGSHLQEIVATCCRKDPERRYSDFGILRQELNDLYQATHGHGVPKLQAARIGSRELVNLGASMLSLKQYQRGLDCFERALQINDRDKIAWLLKGHVQRKLSDEDAALTCYNTALSIDPEYVPALMAKGALLTRRDAMEEALNCCERAVAAAADQSIVWNNMGNALAKTGDFGRARECQEKAVHLRPDNVNAWVELSWTRRQLDDITGAYEAFRRARELAPNHPAIDQLAVLFDMFRSD